MKKSKELLSEKKGKIRKRNEIQKRLNQVSSVKNSLSNYVDDNVNAINIQIDYIKNSLENSMSGISSLTPLLDQFGEKKEKNSDADTHILSYAGNLDSEISDCNSALNDLENDISALNTAYNDALENEKNNN